jgi:hypothetical protein
MKSGLSEKPSRQKTDYDENLETIEIFSPILENEIGCQWNVKMCDLN